MKRKSHAVRNAVAVGAGVAALAAAGYFFFGPNAQKNRKKMKGWMLKMKSEVVENMELVKDMSEPVYHKIVDAAAAKYIATGAIAKQDVAALAAELKKQWKAISGGKAKVKKAVKKVVRRAAPKAKGKKK
jgi:hypothetical protein